MTPMGTHQPVFQWILEQLRSDIHLDRQTIEFAEASYGDLDITTLLAQPDSSEAASFLDLVFQPGQPHRLDYEAKFGHIEFTAQAASALLAALDTADINARIHLPDRDAPMALDVPSEARHAFVQRLNITWSPPEDLRKILTNQVNAACIPFIRDGLRHTRLGWHPGQIDLMALFLERFPATSDDFAPCLAFLLDILNELGGRENPIAFFTAKKQFYHSALTKAEAFERRRQAGNMEILMMQGERAAHGSVDEWRSRMQILDLTCSNLFGYAPQLSQPVTRQFDIRNTPGGLPVADVLKIMDQ